MTVNPSADDIRWEAEAKELVHTGWKDVRDRADKWQTAIGGFLGVFAVVTFVVGPTELDKIPELSGWTLLGQGFRFWVVIAYGVAVISGLAALWFSAKAAIGIPSWVDTLDGRKLEELATDGAKTAIRDLNRAIRSAAISVLVIFLATFAILFAQLQPGEGNKEAQRYLVVGPTGAACGTLSGASGTVVLQLTGGGSTPLTGATQIVMTDACP